MNYFLFIEGMYLQEFTFFNIAVPAADIGKIVVQPDMPPVPHITVGADHVKQHHIQAVVFFIPEQSIMTGLVHKIKEYNDEHES